MTSSLTSTNVASTSSYRPPAIAALPTPPTPPTPPPAPASNAPERGELGAFLRSLEAKNRSTATIRAYAADVRQLLGWLAENTLSPAPERVTRADVTAYFAALGRRGLTGTTRARKLAAVREFFRFLEETDRILRSPCAGVATPRKEQRLRTFLRPEEYARMLAQAGGSARDDAILQVFLQTGVRVGELCALSVADVDLDARTLTVRSGKGVQALRGWLRVRPASPSDALFVNRDGWPLGARGVRDLVARYRTAAGITRRATPHSLRHTFATHKAEQGARGQGGEPLPAAALARARHPQYHAALRPPEPPDRPARDGGDQPVIVDSAP